MTVRIKLVSGVVAVLMPLAACSSAPSGGSGDSAAANSSQQKNCPPSEAGGRMPRYDPKNPNEPPTEINVLSIRDKNLNYLKNTYKVADKGYPLSTGFPLAPSATPGEQSTIPDERTTIPGKTPLNLIPVDNPPAFEELKPLDDLPYNQDGANGRVYNDLSVRFSDPNVTKIADCGLALRTYAYREKPGNQGNQVEKLVGPTIRVEPGQTMKFTVHNDLSGSGENWKPDDHVNLTNLHTHGLEVDPCGKMVAPGSDANPDDPKRACNAASAGNGLAASDNVLISYGPGQSQKYEITVPKDHPSGTFWYHPHRHGSTAPQVSSGMAGALIVEDGDRVPPLLKKIRKEGREKILVFQSMLYNEKGMIDELPEGPEVWGDSGRRVTINGQIAPVIKMRPGEIQRWRMISSSIHELLRLQLADHDLNEIALDGHYLPQVDKWLQSNPNHGVDLLAGYRSDVLVKANSKPGVYMLVNAKNPLSRFNSATATEPERQRQQILAAVVVANDPDHPVTENEALPTDDEMKNIPDPDKPLPNLEKEWNERRDNNKGNFGEQKLQFDSLIVPVPEKQKDETTKYKQVLKFSINGRIYGEGPGGAPTEKPRELVANNIDRWDLSTEQNRIAAVGAPPGAHIFHIHINPFQVYRVGPNTKGESTEIVWKDSIVVPAGQQVTIYTKYDPRFTGTFVLHCHLLDHEDAGMMELVRVNPPPPVSPPVNPPGGG